MPETIELTQDAWQGVLDGVVEEFATTPLREFAEGQVAIVERDNDERLRNAVGPNGGAWAKLAPSTVAKKGHDLILVDTGALGRSLLHSNDSDAVVEVFDEPGRAGFSRGTSVEYAGFHMSGTARMPARPMVGLEPEYIDALSEDFADTLIDNLKQGG